MSKLTLTYDMKSALTNTDKSSVSNIFENISTRSSVVSLNGRRYSNSYYELTLNEMISQGKYHKLSIAVDSIIFSDDEIWVPIGQDTCLVYVLYSKLNPFYPTVGGQNWDFTRDCTSVSIILSVIEIYAKYMDGYKGRNSLSYLKELWETLPCQSEVNFDIRPKTNNFCLYSHYDLTDTDNAYSV